MDLNFRKLKQQKFLGPQEIAEHKQRWMREGSYNVKIHSDLRSQAKAWCRKHLEQKQWKHADFTAVYEDTFHFEFEEHADMFREYFSDWTS